MYDELGRRWQTVCKMCQSSLWDGGGNRTGGGYDMIKQNQTNTLTIIFSHTQDLLSDCVPAEGLKLSSATNHQGSAARNMTLSDL